MIRRLLVAWLLPTLIMTARAAAQDPVLRPDTITTVADTIPSESRVPRNAFLRAMILPGWGHFYIDSPRRGAVYLALQTSSWFMLVKTLRKLDDARGVDDFLTGLAEDSVRAEMAQDTALNRRLQDPLQFEAAVETYPGLVGARALVTSRERHRQDWIVYTLFFTFFSAADAYVSAHLKEFPDITTSRSPDGGISVGLRWHVGGRQP